MFRMTRDAIGVGALFCAGALVSAAGPMEPRFDRPVGVDAFEIAAHRRRINHHYGGSLHHDALHQGFNRSPVRSSPRPDFPVG
jgi:hypothetical protein